MSHQYPLFPADGSTATPTPKRHTRIGVDLLLVSTVLALAFVGVALSASARAFDQTASTTLVRSLIYLGIGLCAMLAAAGIDYRRLSHPAATWLMLVGVSTLLVAALFTGEINNTHRWIRIAGFSLQPSELAKPVLVLCLAAAIARIDDGIREVSGLARPLMIGGGLAALVLAGRDLGTPVLLGMTTIVLLVVAGARWKHVAALGSMSSVLFVLFAYLEPYRVKRLADFSSALSITPETLNGVEYHLRQSLISIGSGGVFGKGFGSSDGKALYLPEPDDDFVFSVICEELGLIGGLGVLGAFLIIVWRGLVTSERSTDPVGRLIALGATWLLCSQALCHMAVVTGLAPTKGLPLPFVSTGGTSLIASCALAGLVINVSLRGRRYVG